MIRWHYAMARYQPTVSSNGGWICMSELQHLPTLTILIILSGVLHQPFPPRRANWPTHSTHICRLPWIRKPMSAIEEIHKTPYDEKAEPWRAPKHASSEALWGFAAPYVTVSGSIFATSWWRLYEYTKLGGGRRRGEKILKSRAPERKEHVDLLVYALLGIASSCGWLLRVREGRGWPRLIPGPARYTIRPYSDIFSPHFLEQKSPEGEKKLTLR